MRNPNISWIETQKYQKNAGSDKKRTATQLGGCIMKIVLWIPRGKCRVNLWREIIIIITKTVSTFHNGLTANNENQV